MAVAFVVGPSVANEDASRLFTIGGVTLAASVMHTETFQKASITLEAAQRMLAAAADKAEALGKGFVIALVDESGVLKAFARLDGAPLLSVQVAQDKAYTAAGSGIATG